MYIINIIALYVILIKIFYLIAFSNSDGILRLKFVQIVFRHGIRAPLSTYPTNVYNEDYWQKYGGLGELTPQGMDQMYDLGVYLKQYYSSFLTPYYHPSKVRVRSTDSDRSIQSASTLLNGLYQPIEFQKWKRDWLPIPVISCEQEFDHIFAADDCPRYINMKYDIYDTKFCKLIEKENECFMNNLAKLSNISNFSLDRVFSIADNFFVANAMNLESPPWVLEHKDKILKLNDLDLNLLVYTHEMAKLVSGPLLNELIVNIDKVLKEDEDWEIYFFSSHDYYINGLFKLLNLDSIKQPNFAAALFFELYEYTRTGKHFIKVYYKNNPDNSEIKVEQLKIEGCEELCPLEKFYKLTQEKIVSDKEKYCKL